MNEKWITFNFLKSNLKVTISENGVSFNKDVVEALNRPEYIQLLFDEENKLMAIKPCRDTKEKNKVAFYKNKKLKFIRLNYSALKDYIEKMLSFDLHMNIYKCHGEMQEGVVVFDLKKCKKM